MTRRVAITGVLAVCASALLVGVIAYILVSQDARNSEDQVLRNLVANRKIALGSKTTYSQLAQLTNPHGVIIRETIALQVLGQLPTDLRRGYADVQLGARHLRVLTQTGSHGYRFSVAVYDAPARSSLATLRRGVAIGIIVAALLASLVLVWITRRALAPVRETARVADRIVSTGDLTARVPVPAGTDEIARLSYSLNRMLDHLEDSDAALRRLVADASHELRSPVTTLRGNLELLNAGLLADADQAEALADTQAEAERLGRLVEELLSLARADTVTPSSDVLVADLVADAIDGTGARLLHPSREFAAATVRGDPVALRTMVHNLAVNADRYGGGGDIAVDGDHSFVAIHVADHGEGVPPEQHELIFDRFRRGDNAAGLPGSGLGLAIVAATARAHGGSVSLTDTPGGGATFTVRLPRSSDNRVSERRVSERRPAER